MHISPATSWSVHGGAVARRVRPLEGREVVQGPRAAAGEEGDLVKELEVAALLDEVCTGMPPPRRRPPNEMNWVGADIH